MSAPDPDVAQEAIEYAYAQGWSDGLPLVPVSEPLLDRFLAQTARRPDDVIGHMPQVDREVTVRTAAINAAMAGCLPEYFPVVLAAWDALMRERAAKGGGWQSTSGPAPLIIVNGPVRERLGLNSTGGIFGPGFRANATIPRAIGLIVRNAFGVRPHELEQATQGIPGRWAICFGENEEDSPWAPLAEELGTPGDAVTTTLLRTSEYVDNRHTQDAEQLLGDFADTIGRSGSWIFRHAQVGLVLCPEHAERLAVAGFDRRGIAEWLAERSGRTTAQLARAGKDHADERGVRFPRGDGDPEAFQRTIADPAGMLIAVAGARTAAISMVVRYFADWSGSAVPIEAPVAAAVGAR
ncbi:hypothetical protein [Microbacterium sediminis]|uniref:Uncharacterized protein n=1 Tax=Microbacterium sediminis TaxID=904291 RepID=A0A1B9NIE8_9MICO|nr:hypothetical protein [Microbacterium sediminis]OCG76340.1 hypothetical protein A7J15_12050 [Microbacterium sediminis]QBR73114.1 hypothetical protein E3O41_00770 [Microbacterium sediminis]